jgi:acid phosphatase type 7
MKYQHNWIPALAFLLLIAVPCSSFQNTTFSIFDRAVIQKGKPIVIYGDSRSGHVIHKKIISCILGLKPEAVFHTGDLVFNGKSNKGWNIFNSIVGDLLKVAPIYPALGNHECGTIKINEQLSLPNNGRWYSVDIQNIHFIVMDVCAKYSEGSEQYNWLVKDLENQPKTTQFTSVITHYPPYCTGPHHTGQKKLRKELVPVFKKYGVDVVFSGHNHSYERAYSEGIYYIVTAGGGAPLYDQSSHESYSQLYIKDYNFCVLEQDRDTLIVNAMDTAMHCIDHFFIPPAK